MEVISGKNLCKLIYETLELIDPRPIAHGERTSYIVTKMLQNLSGYEAYQIADMDFISTLHDIGAYKTEDLNDALRYESKDFGKHSVYGFLFLKYLSPYRDMSKILLYHHTDERQAATIQYGHMDLAMYLHLAEAVDIYRKAMGTKFNLQMFNKYVDVKYSKNSIELINQAETKYSFLGKLEDGSYREELDQIRKYQVFSKEDTNKLLQFLTYCLGFSNDVTAMATFSCASICKAIAKKLTLSDEDATILYYAAIVHDIGMMSVPQEILKAPRKLTAEEIVKVRTHVVNTGQVLNGKIRQNVIDVALAHHERFDGSGYPKKLSGGSMNMLMAILQVADTAAALIGDRNYRIKPSNQQVCQLLKEEARKGRLHMAVVDAFVENFDEIMRMIQTDQEQVFSVYQKMESKFQQACGTEAGKS